MNYTYIILTAEQEATLSNWMSKLTEENFGDMWNTRFEKEFCAFVNYRGDKLYKIRKNQISFMIAVINSHRGGDHTYNSDLDTVHNVCGDRHTRSLQNFLDWIL